MARIVRHARIESPTGRGKLKPGRYYQSLTDGKAHLGYQRKDDAPHGRWFLRRYVGKDKYKITPLGPADDQKGVEADGVAVLDFGQAKTKALELLKDGPKSKPKGTHTVRDAFVEYLKHVKRENGERSEKMISQRVAAVILPELGDVKLVDLTTTAIENWRDGVVTRPALLRSKADAKERNTKPKPIDANAIRARKCSANRLTGMLKAALNYIYYVHQKKTKERWVDSNDAWALVKQFKKVEVSRARYLQIDEAKRLINACEPSFRLVVQAALQTGCRYGELCRLKVEDFERDIGKLAIWISKSGKPRHITLTAEGVAFFTQVTAGRHKKEFMFRNEGRVKRALDRERQRLKAEGKDPAKAKIDDDGAWRAAEQVVPMREACTAAKIDPPISIHGMRHTWASHAIMNGVPLMVAAENLGHADTQMVQKHYGHLSDSYKEKAIRESAPRFGFEPDQKIKTLHAR